MSAGALAAVYATIPHIECRGLCSRSCGPVIVEVAEAQATGAPFITVDLAPQDWAWLQARSTGAPHMSELMLGVARRPIASFGMDRKLRCNLLRNGRCTVYENRPGICRLWGVVETMPCHMGCIPERWLTDDEGRAVLEAIREACDA